MKVLCNYCGDQFLELPELINQKVVVKDNQDRRTAYYSSEMENVKSLRAQNLQQRIDILRNDIRELGYEVDNNPSIANILNKSIIRYQLELADLERQLAEL